MKRQYLLALLVVLSTSSQPSMAGLAKPAVKTEQAAPAAEQAKSEAPATAPASPEAPAKGGSSQPKVTAKKPVPATLTEVDRILLRKIGKALEGAN